MMFLQLLTPAICAACNMYGGIGLGYEYKGFGTGVAWVDRHTRIGKIDEDAMAVTASYSALKLGRMSIGPYVAKTFAPDRKGPPSVFVSGLQIEVRP
jgi:hypothetical protein